MTDYNLSEDLLEAGLDNLLEKMANYCLSIYLTGSWSANRAGKRSDIDIDVLASNEKSKSKLLHLIQSENHKIKTRLDAKVFTKEELVKIMRSPAHFFFWTRFNSGILLYGKSIDFELDYARTRRYIEIALDRMSEAVSLYESNQRMGVVLFLLYESLSGSFFLSQYFDTNKMLFESKEQLLTKKLDSLYSKAERIYRSSTSSNGKEKLSPSKWPFTISFHKSIQLTESELEKLAYLVPRIDTYVNETYHEVLKNIDRMMDM